MVGSIGTEPIALTLGIADSPRRRPSDRETPAPDSPAPADAASAAPTPESGFSAPPPPLPEPPPPEAFAAAIESTGLPATTAATLELFRRIGWRWVPPPSDLKLTDRRA